jgi:predicted unusual protein kinase regulating ubiquinone biosynthesis (AarF/ABC1/UbiB family)
MAAHRKLMMRVETRPDAIERYDADIKNVRDYMQTFQATFPKGIKIEPKEVTEIMGLIASPEVTYRYEKARANSQQK